MSEVTAASRRALLVIDMQNLFCHRDGTVTKLVGPLYEADRAIDGAARRIAAARAAGTQVIYTRHCYDPDYLSAGPNFAGPNPIGVTGKELMRLRAFIAGTWDSDIIDDLAPAPGDIVIDKTRYDAFLNTPLDAMLHNLGVRELDLCGVVTNVCVETTTRAAFMRDYVCTVHADATTAGTQRLHENALEAIDSGCFATIAA